LLLIVLPEEDGTDSSEHSRIGGQFSQNNLVPFQSLLCVADVLIDVCDLEDSLWNRDDGLDLL